MVLFGVFVVEVLFGCLSRNDHSMGNTIKEKQLKGSQIGDGSMRCLQKESQIGDGSMRNRQREQRQE